MLQRYIFTLLVCLYPLSSAWGWETLSSFEELHINPQTDLVLWDLDHTLIEPHTYEGSEPWFQNLIKTNQGQLSFDAIIQLYCLSQNNISLRVTEEILQKKWATWTATTPMIGITSRSYSLSDLTHTHLRNLGIPLDTVHFDPSCFPEVASHGILFTSGGVKQKFVQKLLDRHPEYRQRCLVFIDDSLHHLEAMEQYFEAEGLTFRVYHYTKSRDKYEKARCID